MADLTSLIASIEAATEGSRELDAEVYEAVVGLRMYESIHERGGDLCLRYYPGPPGPEYGRLPRYTTSLDAVMSLMPEGWIICSFRNGDLDRKYFDVRRHTNWTVMLARVGVVIETPADISQFPVGKAPTPALALLVAILKARQTAAQPAKQAEAR